MHNIEEDGHAEGGVKLAVRDGDRPQATQVPNACPCQNQVVLPKWKAWYHTVLVYGLPLLVSTCALAFAVVSATASWKALNAANKANNWAYLNYNSLLVQIQFSLIQLCINNPAIDAETCKKVRAWNYLPSVYNTYHPDRFQAVPTVPSPVFRRLSSTTVAVTVLAVTESTIPLVTIAVLVTGWLMIRRSAGASSGREPGPFLGLSQAISTKMLALLSSIGLREKGLPPGHQRIWWTNGHGKKLYDDYIEHEPGALQTLQEYLNASAYRTRMTPQGVQDRTSSPFGFPHPSNNSSAWPHSSDCGDIADQMRETTVRGGRINGVQKDIERSEMHTRTLHLLSCMDKGRHSVELRQELITDIMDDRQLFHTLRRSYHEYRGRFRPYWSLRTVHSIHFMKFAYGGRRYIDVRCHDDICEPGKPCGCIPPPDIVIPKGTEYECYPVPSKLCPPVGQRLMMDFFTDPDGIESDTTLVMQQLPKRACGELRSQSELTEAWGIYYKEDWDWAKIRWVLAIGFFPPSLLFGILWGILKKDLQGAFGVASWWMTGATILIGIVGTCT